MPLKKHQKTNHIAVGTLKCGDSEACHGHVFGFPDAGGGWDEEGRPMAKFLQRFSGLPGNPVHRHATSSVAISTPNITCFYSSRK